MSEQSTKRAAVTKDKVTVRDLNFYYGETHALKNVELSLYRTS